MLKFKYIIFICVSFALSATESFLHAAAEVSAVSEADIDLAIQKSTSGPNTKAILMHLNAHQDEIKFEAAKTISSTFSKEMSDTAKAEAVDGFLSALQILSFVEAEGPAAILFRGTGGGDGYNACHISAQKVVSAHYLMLMDALTPLNALSGHLFEVGVKNSDADGRLKGINKLDGICGRMDDLIWPFFMAFN